MTPDGYRARIACVEWHANLWRIYGTPIERCEAMLQYCSESIDADFYGAQRRVTDDPEIARMMSALDHLFATHDGVLVNFA